MEDSVNIYAGHFFYVLKIFGSPFQKVTHKLVLPLPALGRCGLDILLLISRVYPNVLLGFDLCPIHLHPLKLNQSYMHINLNLECKKSLIFFMWRRVCDMYRHLHIRKMHYLTLLYVFTEAMDNLPADFLSACEVGGGTLLMHTSVNDWCAIIGCC